MDEYLKSEQDTNPEAGKEGSILNLGITMIPVCVLPGKHTNRDRSHRAHTQSV